MSDRNGPDLVGVGAIFIDDIVLPDGQTYMAQLGGGTIHALMGSVLWDERPGLSAFAGQGLPENIHPYLNRFMDTGGLVHLNIPQMRAWQLFEPDGKRTEVHRVSITAPFVTGTRPDHMPESYHKAKAFYLLQDYIGIRRWRNAVDGLILWEPNALMMQPENREAFRAVLRECVVDVVSPNLEEARVIYGYLKPDALVDAMLSDGAKVVALRMGEKGSIVAADHGAWHRIGAVEAQVRDQTGAGNTYCGALLTGLMRGRSLHEAAMMGAVASSFCLETIGVLHPDEVNTGERDRRFRLLGVM